MPANAKPLKVVLCWHMHQPYYRGPAGSDYELPWVYLHGIKDYSDMAFHLENHGKARAVVNFAPLLLEQIEDYSHQTRRWLKTGERISDPLLAALAGPGVPLGLRERRKLIKDCLRANEKRLINRFEGFRDLVDIAHWIDHQPHNYGYLNDQYMVDLLVWYHLAWMGESIRHNDLRVISLEKKKRNFNENDRRQLLSVIADVLGGLIDRYRRLAESGRVELSVTPYAHPILPLFYNFHVARESLPDMRLPDTGDYPGGRERAVWHVRKGLEIFQRHFGFRPKGCWPSEGALSDDSVRLLEEEGFHWVASGQQVLSNSLKAMKADISAPASWVHTAYRLGDKGNMHGFFRDDGLSDLIGFTYSDWHADDAVGNLIQHLENIDRATRGDPNRVVSIIMDGENAWEYYPDNGVYFLDALYKRLSNHPTLALSTFSDYLDDLSGGPARLPHVVAGSWVYGTLSTWIGDMDKNRGWEMLVDAKKIYDQAMEKRTYDEETLRKIEQQLATCEGSDWFWWFGDYNPGQAVSDFEHLFRLQLSHLHLLLGEKPPEYLHHVFAHGSGDPSMGGVMRRNN
ncbi:MAG: glycoside hydrolase [Gammaproteobacteria bacterium RIFOXYA12_FULL_61_12]|nr:MAG: glycoside hydrolase [Gammaproteobacteria bacterium RIFOXYD12_FULL_61_37]OGT92360.1 MAG: glycoside hydrolase [Gammaproteobacteria bacterium RIFOXYA12_FULL_61_12]